MSKATDILSLEEILMEGTTDTLKDRHSKMDRLRANVQQVLRNDSTSHKCVIRHSHGKIGNCHCNRKCL